ncbi:lectin [Paenibacillus larvae]|uniref:lectin n=1 Tax=Paenibacillus larvae TaxID=1464 RepID=UPI0016627449|nr:lectin [Paenibacillus larvae]MCY7520765.1 lectin [Paenibacillus larvae]MCY9501546.1 lectin [Paenibacillus larvae]MCY9680553.1 lectin [Paenibacillus larvae]MCY9747420.1 lectin [Paenibacillus larvae]MCY9748306.1 lectin [Paenibacillus larvae]
MIVYEEVICSFICRMHVGFVQCSTFAAVGQHYLNEGESLVRGQWLKSNNGEYTLILQDDGNLVLYGRGKALWNTITHGLAAKNLVMQSDGNLVLYGYSGALWHQPK